MRHLCTQNTRPPGLRVRPALLLLGAGVVLPAVAYCAPSAGEPPRRTLEPGLAFTFDDHTVANWVKALPIFERTGARVTFFVDQWDRLTPKQIDGLRTLHRAGHAIACHGLRHRKAVEYCRSFSLQKYLDDEILPAMRLMQRDGFHPAAFAYPCSQHDAETDRALLRIFRRLRSGCGRPAGTPLAQLDPIYTPVDRLGERRCLIGTCVQPHSLDDRLLEEVRDAFRRARQRRELVVFYAHDIRPADQPGPPNFITPEALAKILVAARAVGLRFYSFEDLP